VNSCDHCEAVRFRQAQISGGRPLTPNMIFPHKYFTAVSEPGLYDRLDGPCECRCHDVWYAWCRLTGAS
jgi:hypothetical protein